MDKFRIQAHISVSGKETTQQMEFEATLKDAYEGFLELAKTLRLLHGTRNVGELTLEWNDKGRWVTAMTLSAIKSGPGM